MTYETCTQRLKAYTSTYVKEQVNLGNGWMDYVQVYLIYGFYYNVITPLTPKRPKCHYTQRLRPCS
jgi:hypothetical protein